MTDEFKRAAGKIPALKASAHPWILFGFLVVLAIFGLVGSWAATARIASAVIAQGQVSVAGKRKLIQHLEGGIVQKLLVHDGDVVEAGQTLVKLDPIRAQASLGIVEAALNKALATEARLVAEREGLDAVAYPQALLEGRGEPGIAALLKSNDSIFRARRTALNGENEILTQRIAQLGEEINGLNAQKEAKDQQSRFIQDELDGLQHLFERGQTTKPRVLALQRGAAALKGEAGELVASMARSKKNIGETKLQILQREKDFQKGVAEELQEVQARLRDLRERKIASEDILRRIDITTPVGGVVVNSLVHTVGAVIKPGETIMEIVPGKDNLIIEATIRPQDIDNVTFGQAAAIRMLAFEQRTTPMLHGEVVYVSADSLEDRQSRQTYYRADVSLSDEELARLGKLTLKPGMQAEVMIQTGERTALDYIVQPIIASMNRAMREQ